jgi:phospholipase/lecithinase/hemolysin
MPYPRALRPLALFLALLAFSPPAFAGTVSIGVIGDSVADEYQFYPSQQAAQNFVEILSARSNTTTTYDFGSFTTTTRSQPRNQGYEFNWAAPDARTDDMRPQVEGLAVQIGSGHVKYGMAFIGTNNFRDVLYNGADPVETSRGGIGNTAAAVSTLLAASPDFRIALANVPDITLFPEARTALSADPSLTPKITQVRSLIDTYNQALAFQFAHNPRVSIVDANALLNTLSTGPTISGITLDPVNPGPDLSNLFVDPTHPGTIAQSLLADAFLAALDLTPGPTPTPTPIPLPAAVWAALAGVPVVIAGVRRTRRYPGRRASRRAATSGLRCVSRGH